MKKILSIGLCCMFPCLIGASVIEHNISLTPEELNISTVGEYDYIIYPGAVYIEEPGHPRLPLLSLCFVIPPDAHIEKVAVVNEEGLYLEGAYKVFPAQEPVPVSFSTGEEFTLPDKEIYSQNELYPDVLVYQESEGNLAGFHLATVSVSPCRYLPATGKLYFSTHMTLRIYYTSSSAPVKSITETQKESAIRRISPLVVNKEDIERFSPPISKGLWDSEYIIITNQAFVNAFKPLKEWKSRRGMPTEIVSTSWIYSNYSGADNAARIRNFISDAADSGALYFLLAGQCDYEHGEEYVPRRNTYFYTSNVGYYPDEDTLPCDLYFSDLDGTWDGNNNGIYGEFSDGVDMYSDVYVGRAPVKDTNQIKNFISKVIAYEKCPSASYVEKILLPVGNLWSGNYGNGINDTIADTIPNDWQKSKLYESSGLMSRYITRDSLSQGFQFCHMVGHGNEYGEYYNYGSSVYYYHSDPASQSNDSTEAAIVNSMGCFCGGLDEAGGSANYDCLAERMVNVNKRAAVATIMNTRYGWGYSSPQGALGPSGELSVWFYRKLFGTNAYHLGEVLAAAKDQKASQGNTWWWRWCLFEYNLFGDPEMPLWTDATKSLTVSYSSDTIAVFGDGKPDTFTVTVQYSGSPVSGALVTIMQDSTAYERATSNGSGQARFILPDNTFQHQGYAWVTVTHYSANYLPDLDSAQVVYGTGSVAENKAKTNYWLKLSPNPIKDRLSLNFNAPITRKTEVKLYDVKGSLVKSLNMEIGASKIDIPVTELNGGVYFLKIDGVLNVERKIILVK